MSVRLTTLTTPTYIEIITHITPITGGVVSGMKDLVTTITMPFTILQCDNFERVMMWRGVRRIGSRWDRGWRGMKVWGLVGNASPTNIKVSTMTTTISVSIVVFVTKITCPQLAVDGGERMGMGVVVMTVGTQVVINTCVTTISGSHIVRTSRDNPTVITMPGIITSISYFL